MTGLQCNCIGLAFLKKKSVRSCMRMWSTQRNRKLTEKKMYWILKNPALFKVRVIINKRGKINPWGEGVKKAWNNFRKI